MTLIIAAAVGLSCSGNQHGNQTTGATGAVGTDTKNPLTDLRAAADAGRPLYITNCSICHGAEGKGDGPSSVALIAQPTDLTGREVATSPDGKIFLTVKEGVMKHGTLTMPPVTRLTDRQIWEVIAYLRSIGSIEHK